MATLKKKKWSILALMFPGLIAGVLTYRLGVSETSRGCIFGGYTNNTSPPTGCMYYQNHTRSEALEADADDDELRADCDGANGPCVGQRDTASGTCGGGAGSDGNGNVRIWTTSSEAIACAAREEDLDADGKYRGRVDGKVNAAYHQCVRDTGACRAGTCGGSAANFRTACNACATANFSPTCNTAALRAICFSKVKSLDGLSGTGTDDCEGTPDGNPNNGWQCGCTQGGTDVAGSCATECS